MEAQMSTETTIDGLLYWDFYVDTDQGIVPFLDEENEKNQEAAIAVYLTKDSTPQLSGSGQYVDWLGFFTNEISFGELDSNIRTSLNNAGLNEYYPSYAIENDQLKVGLTNP
jgi:hypothetical protein